MNSSAAPNLTSFSTGGMFLCVRSYAGWSSIVFYMFVFSYIFCVTVYTHVFYICLFVFLVERLGGPQLYLICLYFCISFVFVFFCISGRVLTVPGLGGPPSHGLAPAETDFRRFGADFEGSPGQVPLFR